MPHSDGSSRYDAKIDPWLKGWLTDMRRGRQIASLQLTAMHGYTNKPLPAPPTTYDVQPDNGARIVRSEDSGLEYDVVARPNGRGDGYDVLKQLPTINGKRPRTAMSLTPDDYRGQHQAPDPEYGSSMDNPDMMFPDIATHPEYYDTYQPYDYQSHSAISRSRGRPDRKVDIYRALPMSAVGKNGRGQFFPLNGGDWVTPSYDYAKEHGESNLDQREPWTILHTKVPAGQLYSEGNSIHEWAYQGDNKLTVEHPRARQQRYRRTKRGPLE